MDTGNCDVLVEPLPDSDFEWRVDGGRVPFRICNPNPYPVEVPQRQPLAQVFEVTKGDIQGEQELVLNSDEADVVEVSIRRAGVTEVENDLNLHPVFSLKGDGLTPDQQNKGWELEILCRLQKTECADP